MLQYDCEETAMNSWSEYLVNAGSVAGQPDERRRGLNVNQNSFQPFTNAFQCCMLICICNIILLPFVPAHICFLYNTSLVMLLGRKKMFLETPAVTYQTESTVGKAPASRCPRFKEPHSPTQRKSVPSKEIPAPSPSPSTDLKPRPNPQPTHNHPKKNTNASPTHSHPPPET